jgi:hypothetical protein
MILLFILFIVKMEMFNSGIGENGVKLNKLRLKWIKRQFQVTGFKFKVTGFRLPRRRTDLSGPQQQTDIAS